jgi:serine/threonine protein kinase
MPRNCHACLLELGLSVYSSLAQGSLVTAPTDGPFDKFRDADGTVTSGAAKSEIATAFRPGMTIDQSYRLIEAIGQGAMGVVFSCTHLVLQKNYAIKFLLADELSSEAWNRFQVEAKALAKLNHRGIVGIHNMGIHHGLDDNTPYYVMDLLSGENLDDLLKKSGPLTVERALDYFIQVADALHSAHTQGVVHRDIKPSNLMLLRDKKGLISQIKIVDFGIARVNRSGHGSQSQTATGLVFGTPYYMSPEQCRGERVDHRADIYSLGCTLFEALTGQPPFKGSNAFQTFMMHQGADVPSLESRSAEAVGGEKFSHGLEALVTKTLQKNAADRYQSMEQLKHDLERVQQGKDVSTRGLRNTIAPMKNSDRSRVETSDLGRGLTYGRLRQSELGDESSDDLEVESAGDEAGDDSGADNGRALVLSQWQLVLAMIVAASVITVFVFFVWSQSSKTDVSSKVHTSKTDNQLVTPEKNDSANLASSRFPSSSSIDGGVLGLPNFGGGGENSELEIFHKAAREKMSPQQLLEQVGASQAEKKMFENFDWVSEIEYESAAQKKADQYVRLTSAPGVAPIFYKSNGAFHFPRQVYLGAIQFDNGPIQSTRGDMPAVNRKTKRPAQEVHLYLSALTKDFVGMLDRFRADEVTAVDMKFNDPRAAMKRLRKWKRLTELSFFNGLTKSLPTYEEKLENSPVTDDMLPEIDRFSTLRSLGLAGNGLSGLAIAKMTLLGKVQTLKIKGIKNPQPLLEKLSRCDNIQELWLMSLYLQDHDLEPLTRMKNLRSLRITRSRLSPNSLSCFKRMPNLKQLKLDRSWSEEKTKQFKTNIPGYEFEPVFDTYFWDLTPDGRKL